MNPFELFINQLPQHPDLHAKFVNTLSMLEYIGARKILKSQQETTFSLQLLTHASEEIRHAEILKKVVLKMSNGQLTSYDEEDLCCGDAARTYFQEVDKRIAEVLHTHETWVNYLFTTLVIEERAHYVYPVYHTILTDAGVSTVVKSILREETKHLEEIRGHLEQLPIQQTLLPQIREIEEKAFHTFARRLVEASEK
ncbi:ferritin-like domain-containing protein [Pajaroellobacter abortibovis]|uniref:Rubrerythrin diiron-binding domain-containing protein n=1 Tax=Pajaroellobacter abortibovis TaxID=1882918 RepID=A0A1L6MZB2_9BACT|nr:ferritin-like domain-containing protein [Pajaroellobacter abortibovis]APS00765.1 hypothetical protein BCY86_08800 [Pajaroellobacter abortibovis]